ncbi:MAG: ATP synthase F1 subunit epsilon [Acidobacteriaceae bacterium]|nr:ATP synthase F1 subunit epsilon [Acidobacteriaceae bacterium]
MADRNNNSELLHVRLVTPDRVLLDSTASAVELPSISGYLEALYGAAPLLSELGAGEVRLHGGATGEQIFFVASGVVEVLPDRVTILAETALRPEEIDVKAAEAELVQSQEMWKQAGDEQQKYDEANTVARVAEEKIASATHRNATR